MVEERLDEVAKGTFFSPAASDQILPSTHTRSTNHPRTGCHGAQMVLQRWPPVSPTRATGAVASSGHRDSAGPASTAATPSGVGSVKNVDTELHKDLFTTGGGGLRRKRLCQSCWTRLPQPLP